MNLCLACQVGSHDNCDSRFRQKRLCECVICWGDPAEPLDRLVERLHGLVETACHGWKNALPVETPGESAAVHQDRLTASDLMWQADSLKQQLLGRLAPQKIVRQP